MAEVYRSTLVGAEGFSRTVAVKRILGSYSADPTFAEMFVNEANIASLLSHPNIVSVLDFDRDDSGQLFLVMELIEGCDLKGLIDHGRLPVAIVAFIVAEVLRALSFAHSLERDGRTLSIVHRDISPHNVLVSWDGAVKLSDFGIAKAAEATRVTQSGLIKGKVSYMSPEQAEGAYVDGRSDLFAVGILLHELLTGKRLFGGAPDRVVLNRILIGEITPPSRLSADVPEVLDSICMRLLERDLGRRYQRAQDALEDLIMSGLISPRAQLELARIMKERSSAKGVQPATATTDAVEVALTEPATRTNTVGATLVRTKRKSWPIAALLVASALGIVAVRWVGPAPVVAPKVIAPTPLTSNRPAPSSLDPGTPADPAVPPAVKRVRITSNPAGAGVHVDGNAEPLGTTPFELDLPQGATAPIELRLEGHRPAAHVLRGEDLHVELARLSAPKKRKKKTRDGILPPEKRIGDGILRPNL